MPGKLITACQSCGGTGLEEVFWAGWLPPVNTYRPAGESPVAEERYPARLMRCPSCTLVQMEYQGDFRTVFPQSYSYRSGCTAALRQNFADLANEVSHLFPDTRGGLVVDVGCNDGTLLEEFRKQRYRVQGVEPTDAYRDAHLKKIEVLPRPFDNDAAEQVRRCRGPASVVTLCNVFAHIPNPSTVLHNVLHMLDENGVVVIEVHYLPDLLAGVQYDTLYHEHLFYYSLTSLEELLKRNGLAIVRAGRIPTHGGSVRVYAMRRNALVGANVLNGVKLSLLEEESGFTGTHYGWPKFRADVSAAKWALYVLLNDVGMQRVFAVGAPSRAVTLASYCGLDVDTVECVCEVPGSLKVGGYLPGTRIPVVDEKALFEQQPDYALLFSWHLADELIPKLKAKGFAGKFIVPLPDPRVVG